MSDFDESGELRRRRSFEVPGRDARCTWVGDEEPTEKDLEAMRALVDAAMKKSWHLLAPRPERP